MCTTSVPLIHAGVDEDFNKTIAATDLDRENYLAVW